MVINNIHEREVAYENIKASTLIKSFTILMIGMLFILAFNFYSNEIDSSPFVPSMFPFVANVQKTSFHT